MTGEWQCKIEFTHDFNKLGWGDTADEAGENAVRGLIEKLGLDFMELIDEGDIRARCKKVGEVRR